MIYRIKNQPSPHYSAVVGTSGTYQNGTDNTSQNQFIFDTCGIHNVELTVTDANGCTHTYYFPTYRSIL